MVGEEEEETGVGGKRGEELGGGRELEKREKVERGRRTWIENVIVSDYEKERGLRALPRSILKKGFCLHCRLVLSPFGVIS